MYTHDEVADDCHAGTVARELLVGHLRIVFLRLYKLMVEIKVVRRSCHELACAQEGLSSRLFSFVAGLNS